MDFNFGKKIGEGTESNVFEDADDPKRVIKFKKGTQQESWSYEKDKSPQYQKAAFYMAAILKLVFPKNFPQVHNVDARYNALTQERVNLDASHLSAKENSEGYREFSARMREKYGKSSWQDEGVMSEDETKELLQFQARELQSDQEILDVMTPFKQELLDAGITVSGMGAAMDDAPVNFSRTGSGDIIYLDEVEPWQNEFDTRLSFDKESLKRKIEQLPEVEKRQALAYLTRIEQLFEESRSKKTST